MKFMFNKSGLIKSKILFTIFVLIFYRIGSFVPIPCIDLSKISLFSEMTKNGIFTIFNTFSGGSIARASIFALGIMPYITSSIIIQLFIATNPELKKMKKEGGEKFSTIVSKYTKYLTVPIAILQSLGISTILLSNNVNITNPYEFKLITSTTMLCGTFILIWLGDRISHSGIGNGTSLIIFTGIVGEAPKDLMNIINLSRSGKISIFELFMIFAIFVSIILLIVLIERSYKIINIQYPRQVQTMMQQNRQSLPSFMPLKLNLAGVIPPIFASSILLMPSTIASIFFNGSNTNKILITILSNFNHGTIVFIIIQAILIIFFSFFYNNVIFDPDEVSEQLKKSNVFIPGIRPGNATAAFFKQIISRLSLIGALYLVIICSAQEILSPIYGYSFLIGGTGLLIIVNVIVDTMSSIQTHLLPNRYEKSVRKYK